MNTVHPTAVISDDVVLGDGNTVGPFAIITGPVTIGNGNWIGAGTVIGAPPEVRGFAHPRASSDSRGNGVMIGNGNTIREYAQIHQGWKGQTRIGDDTFIMNQCYVAHDCRLEDGVTMASSVLLAGHVTVGSRANLGLGASVHQFRTVGRGSMIGMGSVVVRDLPPFAKAFGNPAVVRDANTIGMQRSGENESLIRTLAAMYSSSAIEDSRSMIEDIEDADVRGEVLRWLQGAER